MRDSNGTAKAGDYIAQLRAMLDGDTVRPVIEDEDEEANTLPKRSHNARVVEFDS